MAIVALTACTQEPGQPVPTATPAATSAVVAATPTAVLTPTVPALGTSTDTPAPPTVSSPASASSAAPPSSTPTPPGSAGSAGPERATEIKDGIFEKEIAIAAGTTVIWTNRDAVFHTITQKGGGVDSGILAKGTEYSRTFTEAGRFEYLCAVHPTMTAVVVIQ